jgi:hypothetical protein
VVSAAFAVVQDFAKVPVLSRLKIA